MNKSPLISQYKDEFWNLSNILSNPLSCQIPATFAECVETAVLTNVDFPQCCWTCAAWTKCDGSGGDGAAGGGEAGGAGEGEAGGGEGAEGAEGEAPAAEGRRAGGKNVKAPDTTTTIRDTTTERVKTRTKGKGGSKRSTTKPDESEFPEENLNIKFGGGSPISKFGEDSI